jgi:hypothetical protein
LLVPSERHKSKTSNKCVALACTFKRIMGRKDLWALEAILNSTAVAKKIAW